MGDARDEKAEAATTAPAYPTHTAAFADALVGRDVCAIGMAGFGASSVVSAFIAHLECRRASDARRIATNALPRPAHRSELVRCVDDATVRSLADDGTADAHTRFVCAIKLAPTSVASLPKLFPRAQRVVHTYHDCGAWVDEHYFVHRFHEPLRAPVDFGAVFRAHFRLDEVDVDGGDTDAKSHDGNEGDGSAERDRSVDERAAIPNEEKS